MDDNNIYLLNIKTIQASTFKQVIDALKEILMDVILDISMRKEAICWDKYAEAARAYKDDYEQ